MSRGLAPELEQLRTQDINPDEDSAAYRALKRISQDESPESPIDSADTGGSSSSRKTSSNKQKKKKKNIEGREIKQVSYDQIQLSPC